MKRLFALCAALLVAALPMPAMAQTFADLTVDPANPPPPLANRFGPQTWVDDGIGADISAYLQTTGTHTDGENGPDDVGAFRMVCNPGQVLADDPVVYPNQPGRSHAHLFYGNLGTKASSTYSSQRTTGLSTCGNILNRSGYWTPALIMLDGRVLRPDTLVVYYKGYPKNNPPCNATPGNTEYVGRCVPIPHGLRFIFGYDMITGTTQGNFSWKCSRVDGTGALTNKYGNLIDAMHECRTILGMTSTTGSQYQLNVTLNAQACWDGVNLDSPNHRSHTSDLLEDFGGTGKFKCPKTHPYVIPFFTLNIAYRMDDTMYVGMSRTSADWSVATADQYIHFSSDSMPGMTPRLPGSTAHGDYFEGWNVVAKALWQDNCIDRWLNCSGGDFGNGKSFLQSPEGTIITGAIASPRLVKRPKLTKEAVTIRLHKM